MQPITYKCNAWSDFIDNGLVIKGQTLLLVVEHTEALDDSVLRDLNPWTPQEKNHIGKFRNQTAKTSWCISRFLAYTALAQALRKDKQEISFTVGSHGKPYLRDYQAYFNWSHCAGCVVLALNFDGEVGCDIEDLTRPVPEVDSIIDEYFSNSEAFWIRCVQDAEMQKRRFINLFTQKEAYLKATGVGLSAPLKEAKVCLEDVPFVAPTKLTFLTGARNNYIVSLCQPDIEFFSTRIKYHRLRV